MPWRAPACTCRFGRACGRQSRRWNHSCLRFIQHHTFPLWVAASHTRTTVSFCGALCVCTTRSVAKLVSDKVGKYRISFVLNYITPHLMHQNFNHDESNVMYGSGTHSTVSPRLKARNTCGRRMVLKLRRRSVRAGRLSTRN